MPVIKAFFILIKYDCGAWGNYFSCLRRNLGSLRSLQFRMRGKNNFPKPHLKNKIKKRLKQRLTIY
ncbi:MAG: hypothetical protein AUK20_01435 [Parcubacteria group bacterium CG2_30_45_37]|nr:MAG: hypothetical protein AUK20_01435 [Parcubacteria group bacterium CG2_30_45_37]